MTKRLRRKLSDLTKPVPQGFIAEPNPADPLAAYGSPLDDDISYRTESGSPSRPVDWRNSPAHRAQQVVAALDKEAAGPVPQGFLSSGPDSFAANAAAHLDHAAQELRAALGVSGERSARNIERGTSAALGLVQDIASRANAAAASALPTVSDGQAAQVWADVLDLLAQDGLEPVIYCAKSGRRLGDIDPLPWRDHLTAIHSLGESQVADKALTRLYAAIAAQLGHTIAVPLLVTSQDSLALLRELHPVDYVLVGLSRLIPAIPARGDLAQSAALAVRAQMLGAMRRDACNLSRPVVEYLAECLTLYLSHVTPSKVPHKHSALLYYDVERWRAALSSPASVSHLCNRLILTLWQLIQSRRLRPSNNISLSDLRALRVHWSSLGEYQNQRKLRAAIRAASMVYAGRSDVLGADPTTGRGGIRDNPLASAGLGASVLGFDLADLLDMQSALRMTGRKVPIAVHSSVEHTTLTKRRADIERLARDLFQEDAPDAAGIDVSLDLSTIAMSGGLDDSFNSVTYDSPADMLGFDSDADLFAALYAQDDDDADLDGDDADLEPEDEPDYGDDDEQDIANAGLDFSGSVSAMSSFMVPASGSNADRTAAALEQAIRDAAPVRRMTLRKRL